MGNPITELNLEAGTYALFNEWLKGYFDGGTHPVGGNANVRFPTATLGFGQALAPQPENASTSTTAKLFINLVFAATSAKASRRWKPIGGVRQQMFYQPVRFNLWIRTQGGAANGTNARELCQKGSDLLHALLNNAASAKALTQNGILHLRPAEPSPVADTAYILRLMSCAATLRYPVLTQ